jgi:F0F1-type ATP synthase membrane subunit b/b'
MSQTLHDLGGIVLNGLPTFFLVIILAVFVKFLYLKPLEKVLAERFRLTEGARKAAEDSLKNADTKIAEYQDALNRARTEIYQEQAGFLQNLHAEQAELARAARLESDARVAAIKLSIAQEADTARKSLDLQSEALAADIADAILGMSRRAA